MSNFQYPPPPPPPTGAPPAPTHFSNNRRGGNHSGGRGRGRGRGNASGGRGGHPGNFSPQQYPAAGLQPQPFQPSYPPTFPQAGYPQWQTQPAQYNPRPPPTPAASGYGYGYGYQAPATAQYPGQFAYPTASARNVPAPMQPQYNAGAFQQPFAQPVAAPPANFPSFGTGPIRMGFNNGRGRGGHQNTYHGQKRKRDDANKSQPPKVKSAVAPAVPSFGTNLALPPKPPAPVSASIQQHDGNNKKKSKRNRNKKRKTNQLGLTPKVEDGDESDEEGVDEEERLAQLINGENDGYVQHALDYPNHTDIIIPGSFTMTAEYALQSTVRTRSRHG
jgi:hypothetical protein